MKKMYAFIVVGMMLLTGCQRLGVDGGFGGTPGVREDMSDEQEENLQGDLIPVVTIEDELFLSTNEVITLCIQDFTPTGMTFILENETEQEMMYGDAFTVQVLREGQWEDVAYTQAVAFHDIAYNLPAQSITESITLDWRKFYGVLPDGEYRIIKDIYTEDGEVTVEDSFELVDGQHVQVAYYRIAQLDKQQRVIAEREIIDAASMEVIAQALFNILVKSARFEIDTSGVETFYRVTSVYTNDEALDMLFYEVDGVAYGDGTVCDESLYDAMIVLVK